jgi:hypothetical protein
MFKHESILFQYSAGQGIVLAEQFFPVHINAGATFLVIQLPFLGDCIFYPREQLFYSKKLKSFVLPLIPNIKLSQLSNELMLLWQQSNNVDKVA